MIFIRSVMLLAGVLAVMLLGVGTAVGAAPHHAAPPCHGSPATPNDGGSHQPDLDDMKAMACCVACVAADLPAAPPAPDAALARSSDDAALPGPLTGLTPSPEPHPPRDVAI
ncbi:hypothetical protein [Brevundimonas sp.]|jgi:hypothetical protein|uniref:hypothetical protein n=1 Tax=Brevundimonas sp. TaxID=1871086 RepID=UPI002E12A451|nr:hypothetical protein [Brevundimonas sp.]